METLYRSYFKLLRDLGGTLDRLSELAGQKADAVRQDDLTALDETLKQEQPLTLNLRGLEQRRLKLVPQLGLEDVKLSDLPKHCPPELQDEAKKAARDLRKSYDIYRAYSKMVRSALELGLHQIDKCLLDSGVDPKLAAEGYESPTVEPPKNMKTDFRA